MPLPNISLIEQMTKLVSDSIMEKSLLHSMCHGFISRKKDTETSTAQDKPTAISAESLQRAAESVQRHRVSAGTADIMQYGTSPAMAALGMRNVPSYGGREFTFIREDEMAGGKISVSMSGPDRHKAVAVRPRTPMLPQWTEDAPSLESLTHHQIYISMDPMHRCAKIEGRINGLSYKAMERINNIVRHFSEWDAMNARANIAHGILDCITDSVFYDDIDYNQMADDDCWPLFCHALSHRMAGCAGPEIRSIPDYLTNYKFGTAGDCIKAYREKYGITKKDWKALCKKPAWYLFKIGQIDARPHIKFSERLLYNDTMNDFYELYHRNRTQLIGTGFMGWLKDYFERQDKLPEEEREFIQSNVFKYGVRDWLDTTSHRMPPDQCQDILSAYDSLDRLFMEIRDHANPYGHIPADYFYGGVDAGREEYTAHMVRRMQSLMNRNRNMNEDVNRRMREYMNIMPGALFPAGPARIKPDKDEPLEAVAHLPPSFEQDSHKAELIATTMRLYEEGEQMRHCIYDYRKKVESGNYVVYHITGPGCGKNGATCGIQKIKVPEKGVTIKDNGRSHEWHTGKTIDAWKHDQTRGRANSIPDLELMDGFIRQLQDKVAEADGEKQN